MPHHIQIQQLYKSGVKKRALAFPIAWLTDRKQRTKIGSAFSNSDVITSGCQQGSRIGPPFFNFSSTKVLSESVNKMVNKQVTDFSLNSAKVAAKRLLNNFWNLEYADDAAVTLLTRPSDQLINRKILSEYEMWSEDNMMMWNARKSELLALGKVPQDFAVEFCGQAVPQTQQLRYLGVLFESQTKLGSRIDFRSERDARIAKYKLLCDRTPKNLKHASFSTLCSVHLIYLQPILNFASCATGYHRSGHHRSQALKLFSKFFASTPVPKKFEYNNIPITNVQAAKIQDGKQIHQIITGKSFIKLQDINLKITNADEAEVVELYASEFPLKECLLLDFIKPNNLSGFRTSFSFTVKSFWNELDLFAQSIKSSQKFAEHIKNNLICFDYESEKCRRELFDGTLYHNYQKQRQLKKHFRRLKKAKIECNRILNSIFTELLENAIIRSCSSSASTDQPKC